MTKIKNSMKSIMLVVAMLFIAGIALIATGCGEQKTSDPVELTYVAAEAATCEIDGNIAYYYDAVNNKYYQDEDGKVELSYSDDIVIAAIGHDYVEAYYATGYGDETLAGYYYVCSHDNTHYYLNYSSAAVVSEEAFASAVADEAALTLTADVTLSETSATIIDNKSFTIDLNGHKLTCLSVDGSYAALEVNGTDGVLTINDSVGTGEILSSGFGIMAAENGTVVVNGGTIISKESCVSSNNTNDEGNFIINGGSFSALGGIGSIYMPAYGELTITGGTFYSGILIRMGEITITGGTFYSYNPQRFIDMEYDQLGIVSTSYLTSFAYDTIENEYAAQGIWFGNSIAFYTGSYDFNSVTTGRTDNSLTVLISGGTFINDNNASYDKANDTFMVYKAGHYAQTVSIEVNGGTFTSTNGNCLSIYTLSDSSYDVWAYSNNSNTVNIEAPVGLFETTKEE